MSAIALIINIVNVKNIGTGRMNDEIRLLRSLTPNKLLRRRAMGWAF